MRKVLKRSAAIKSNNATPKKRSIFLIIAQHYCFNVSEAGETAKTSCLVFYKPGFFLEDLVCFD